MANAVTRAHVLGPLSVAADLCHKDSGQDSDSGNEVIEFTTPTSRKDRRKQKKQNHVNGILTPPSSDTDSPSRTISNNSLRKNRAPQIPSTLAIHSSMPAASNAAKTAFPLLICSLGNPGPTYAHTLHSAGHTITSHISSVKSYRPFTKGLSGLVSRPDNTTYSFGIFQGFRRERLEGPPDEDDWTFWQSTSLMNISGPGVKKAWREYSKDIIKEGLEPRLVIIHDELESPLGKVSVKEGTASPRGHNGLKSCQSSLGNLKWWRIGVGIGRPESREPDAVSRYVLRKMNSAEMKAMEKASSSVVATLRQISEGKN